MAQGGNTSGRTALMPPCQGAHCWAPRWSNRSRSGVAGGTCLRATSVVERAEEPAHGSANGRGAAVPIAESYPSQRSLQQEALAEDRAVSPPTNRGRAPTGIVNLQPAPAHCTRAGGDETVLEEVDGEGWAEI